MPLLFLVGVLKIVTIQSVFSLEGGQLVFRNVTRNFVVFLPRE